MKWRLNARCGGHDTLRKAGVRPSRPPQAPGFCYAAGRSEKMRPSGRVRAIVGIGPDWLLDPATLQSTLPNDLVMSRECVRAHTDPCSLLQLSRETGSCHVRGAPDRSVRSASPRRSPCARRLHAAHPSRPASGRAHRSLDLDSREPTPSRECRARSSGTVSASSSRWRGRDDRGRRRTDCWNHRLRRDGRDGDRCEEEDQQGRDEFTHGRNV